MGTFKQAITSTRDWDDWCRLMALLRYYGRHNIRII